MKELDSQDIDQYMSDALDVAKGAQEWSGLIDSLLVKETSFFRHRPSMDYVNSWVQNAVREKSLVSRCGYGVSDAQPVKRPTRWRSQLNRR